MAQQPKWTDEALQELADGIATQVFDDMESKMNTGLGSIRPALPLLDSHRPFVMAAIVTAQRRIVQALGLDADVSEIIECGDCHEELAGRAFIVWTIKRKSTPLCLECSAARNRSIDLQ